MAIEETNDIIETDEGDDNTSVNWEARFTKLKERQRSAKTTYENRISELEARVKEAPREVKEVKTEFGLLEEAYLEVKGISDNDEIELVKKWQKDTGKGIKDIVNHPFVKAELENLRTARANALATSGLRSDSKETSKDDMESWLAKGEAPEGTPKKLRQKFLNEKLRRAKDGSAGGKFYND